MNENSIYSYVIRRTAPFIILSLSLLGSIKNAQLVYYYQSMQVLSPNYEAFILNFALYTFIFIAYISLLINNYKRDK